MRSRRRAGNYRNSRQNKVKLNFTPVIVILCLSIGCGYATAKYVVDPVVNYVPPLTADEEKETASQTTEEEASEKKGNSETTEATAAKTDDMVEDDVKVEDIGKVAGYALQFGCYSGEAAAETAMKDIDVAGLQILEQDDMYKIIGETYDTKEKAAAALKELPDTVKAFVTTIYK